MEGKPNKTLIDIYSDATLLAIDMEQTVGEKNDYYITIEQLEWIIQKTYKNKLTNQVTHYEVRRSSNQFRTSQENERVGV